MQHLFWGFPTYWWWEMQLRPQKIYLTLWAVSSAVPIFWGLLSLFALASDNSQWSVAFFDTLYGLSLCLVFPATLLAERYESRLFA